MITIFNRPTGCGWTRPPRRRPGCGAPWRRPGIPYEVKTLRSHSTFGRKFHAGMGYEGFQGASATRTWPIG